MSVKTLHLTNAWHETSGGIATFYRALIDEANRRSCQLVLVVPGEKDSLDEVGDFGKIYHIATTPAPLNRDYRMIWPSQFLKTDTRLLRILAAERPELVEICDKYTLNYLGALLRLRHFKNLDFRPLVVGLSCERMDDSFRSYLGKVPGAQKFCDVYMRWIYFPFFDHHIANSEYTATELRRASCGQVVSRGTWIRPMGVDLDYLSPQRRSPVKRLQLLQKFGATETARLLLYVGRLAPEKNLPLLFQMLHQLAMNSSHDFRLLVAGDGIERARWEQECTERDPGRVVFLGHVKDRDTLADIYANSDFFIHPNAHEPFGIAPLEAMASGLPLIAPSSGGVTSYANSENAWMAEPTVEAFGSAVEQAVADVDRREEKARKAVTTATQYRWDRVAASFLDLYAELHEATKLRRAFSLEPDFLSVPASGLRASLFTGVSQTAERTLALGYKLMSDFKNLRSPKNQRRPGTRVA